MGVAVPPAFAAMDPKTGNCGALIEWFYEEGRQLFVWAGDFLQKCFPDFDREKGTTHNMQNNALIMRAMSLNVVKSDWGLKTNWQQWWVDALVFDALIGNTDRHQDNWGFLFLPGEGISLAPLFDNGTSLGHERHSDKFRSWDKVAFDRYVQAGKHHVRWKTKVGPEVRGHVEVIRRATMQWPGTKQTALSRLSFAPADMAESIADLTKLDLPVRLSAERLDFVLKLLNLRYTILRTELSNDST